MTDVSLRMTNGVAPLSASPIYRCPSDIQNEPQHTEPPLLWLIGAPYRVHVIDEAQSLLPGQFIAAGHIGQLHTMRQIQRLQSDRVHIHCIEHDGRLGLRMGDGNDIFICGCCSPPLISAHLNHATFVAEEVGLEVLSQVELAHVLECVPYAHVLVVDQPEGGNIDKVVLEVLQVERLQVQGGEQVVILVLVHLDLKDAAQELLQVLYFGVHDEVVNLTVLNVRQYTRIRPGLHLAQVNVHARQQSHKVFELD